MKKIEKDIEQILTDDGYTIVTHDAALQKGDTASIGSAEKELIEHITFMVKRVPESAVVQKDDIQTLPEQKAVRKEKIVPQKSRDIEDLEIATIIKYLNWHMDRISQYVIGRSDVIRQAMYAILTGEHLLLLSRTGMAKSYLANFIFNSFEEARVFSSQASKDQTPDNYFGPYNIDEFKKGRIRHNIKGSIIEANLVFLDEFFDASDVVLRSLLSVLNERKFINGAEQIDVAIHSAIATANYMRLNEVTEAVLDRFVYKAILPEDKNVYSQLLIDRTYSMSGGKLIDTSNKIKFSQILYLSDIIRNNHKNIKIVIPDNIYFIKNIMVNRFVSEMRKHDSHYFISPRKQAKITDFLRAAALLNNRYEVTFDDLKEMHFALCTLNSFVTVNASDRLESDVFLDVYQQMMVHLNSTGALKQIDFLFSLRDVFVEIKSNPDQQSVILGKKGLLESLLELFHTVFPTKKKGLKKVTVESLKQSILDLNPVVEEVSELRNGILKEFHDIG